MIMRLLMKKLYFDSFGFVLVKNNKMRIVEYDLIIGNKISIEGVFGK